MKAPPAPSIRIRAHPRAARSRVEWDGKVLQVWVTAPAAEGAANRAVLGLVGDVLDLPVSRLELRKGRRARDKLVEVRGVEPELLSQRLDRLSTGGPG
jgi:uncharacterized protein